MDINHKYLDMLAGIVESSIDIRNEYIQRGWTIVTVPIGSNFIFHIDIYKLNVPFKMQGEYYYWDGQIAFERAEDATMFLLKYA